MFIGQSHIIEQLRFILPSTFEHGSANFLFRGPSGYGKTELAMRVANYYAGTHYIMRLGNNLSFMRDKRVHLWDEVHLCPSFEFFYPLMDANNFILIFTTNEDSVLPEAFVNRCYDFIFTEYEENELKDIVREKSDIILTDMQLSYIIEFCNKNPRQVLSIVQRLNMWQRYNSRLSLMNINDFKLLIEHIFGIVNGMDPLQRRYLELLEKLGGTSSLINIKNMLHIDEGTIKREIEPALLYKGKIRITSRGRSLV